MKCLEHKNKYEVIFIEVKIPKEIRSHKESIFFGLSARQFVCAVLAVGLAAGTYLGLGGIVGKEAASWLCLLIAAPVAVAGFFHYNGMTLEQFLWAFLKSEILCAGPRVFDSVNLHEELFPDLEGLQA
ncbi:PrgI family protein [Butyricicoccus sp.]|uniref:PrgI family protein n=1 Tax=Butyricicoccus sp. TaxID=2049021 RepID=UPI003F14DAE1